MEKKKNRAAETSSLNESLIPLDYQQLEERLEVSPLVPNGHDTGDLELENCCTCKINPPTPRVNSFLVDEEWPVR